MKTIVDVGKYTKLVLEDEKDHKDYRRLLGCEIMLLPLVAVVGFILAVGVIALLCSLLK